MFTLQQRSTTCSHVVSFFLSILYSSDLQVLRIISLFQLEIQAREAGSTRLEKMSCCLNSHSLSKEFSLKVFAGLGSITISVTKISKGGLFWWHIRGLISFYLASLYHGNSNKTCPMASKILKPQSQYLSENGTWYMTFRDLRWSHI